MATYLCLDSSIVVMPQCDVRTETQSRRYLISRLAVLM